MENADVNELVARCVGMKLPLALRATLERELDIAAFCEALDKRGTRKQAEIRTECEQNHLTFRRTVREALHMQTETRDLRAKIISLNERVPRGL